MVMRWQKYGLIFNTKDHVLVDNCTDFAKAPQAIDMGDFVRVYFTSQRQTENKKWLSCPQYVDFTTDFGMVIRTASKPILSVGELGQFDEHGIFPFHVMRQEKRLLAFTSGWSRRKSVSVDMAIGLAESFDEGVSFHRYGGGGPILSASVAEPYMVADAFVLYNNGIFHMWYIYGTDWKKFEESKEPERIYKIAHAYSYDAISWVRNGTPIIADVLDDECQALPSVVFWKGKYHMVFCFRAATGFRENKERAYRLGYAVSSDLQNWQRNDSDLGLDREDKGWDSDMMCYPNFFIKNDELFLLYNGNDFGMNGFGLAKLIDS